MGERRGTKALELWCRRMVEGYKNVRVDNMTTSWRDGLAFCALVSKCSSLKQMPDLIHFDELKKEDVYNNNELAFRVAEEFLNIPALLDPQDMSDYEVPDKLSILTYLSQFYQVFGAQENSLRLKRSSTSEANKSSPTTPPAKMANVVPKRDPCVKCNNPVFLAERLVINESLYHRSCFRCARCSSVLTYGNFYETEKDHEYCCETCPDEEKSTKVDDSNRLSIAQKIALFERESSSVLRKSLSDEEKSKSLSRQAPVNSPALNNFLSAQITTQQPEASDEDEKTVGSLSSDSESDDEKPSAPPVPSNYPSDDIIPSISDKKLTISDHKIISDTPDNFDVTKELTHGKDIEAIANVAKTHSESQVDSKDIQSAHVAVAVSAAVDKKMPEPEEIDDIELLFEQLAEDAVKSPIVSIPFVRVEVPTPTAATKSLIAQETVKEEIKIQVEPVKDEEIEVEVPTETLIVEPEPVENQAEPVELQTASEPEKIETIPEAISQTEETEEKTSSAEVALPAPSEPTVTIAANSIEPSKPIEDSNADDAVYPGDLDPFGDEEKTSKPEPLKRPSLNPFGSCSEDEEENIRPATSDYGTLPKPPRPPLPKTMTLKQATTNPFGSDDEEDEPQKTLATRTPVPTPRKSFLHSATPEPTLRSTSNHNSPGHSFKGSTSSLSSSTDGMSLRRKKKKAPPPPVPVVNVPNGTPTSVVIKTPSSTPRKKRPAPTPPTSTPKVASTVTEPTPSLYITATDFPSSEDTLNASDANDSISTLDSSIDNVSIVSHSNRRLIPLEECLIEEGTTVTQPETEEVTYRRKIVPLSPQSAAEESFEHTERSKDNKEAQNRQRQSQGSLMSMRTGSESNDSLPYLNKSSHGKWKRRKGPAPALPGYSQPQRRILQMLPLQEIRQELEVIEVQQQGLEKQGVMLEKMIRERCEGSADNRTTEELLETLPSSKNPKEVEELILQLFELVNEKNELFRRQAELMYLRRAHRLEEEQADVEYEIRTLMAQPEQNKTDSDKAKEEALIARLVEIVQLRNEVVDCLDRDRLREAEEDLSIKQRMESHTAALDQDYLNQTPTKLSKKEKKKLKEAKKLKNNKKLDADKDLDTSEIKSETSEKKKKKKKFLF